MLLEMLHSFIPMGGRPESEEDGDFTPNFWRDKAVTLLPYDTAEKLDYRKKNFRKILNIQAKWEYLRNNAQVLVDGAAPEKG